mmetsp:Transcript_35831/g.85415  ORF Transcript_35831/g.85415 Transcript_35831/m.85415 type:complete len:98 (+) Transcript_35831:1318-1611(+)
MPTGLCRFAEGARDGELHSMNNQTQCNDLLGNDVGFLPDTRTPLTLVGRSSGGLSRLVTCRYHREPHTSAPNFTRSSNMQAFFIDNMSSSLVQDSIV